MSIVGAVTMMAMLAPGLGSGSMQPTVDAGGLDRSVSYLHVQQVQEPRIWLDREVDPVLEAGDRVRIYYRTDADAYVAIFQIDTDGTTRMLYPRSPTENHYARADRDYRLLFPRSAYWNVDDRPGIGYFFVVTSPAPFDLSDFRYSYYDGGWDLSAVGSTVYSDPYVAMDEYVARLVPDWEYADYGLDFISYNVGAAHEYPRFLCYQCHGFRPYSTWNPYRYTCVNFRVVVYQDPYFYPSYRYRADRVVMVGPRNPTRPRYAFKERAAGEPGTPVRVVRQGTGDDPPAGVARPRAEPRAGRAASPSVVPRSTTTRRRSPSGRDEPARVRSDGGRVALPGAGDSDPRRPTLERRSAAPSQSTPPRAAAPRPRPTEPRRSSPSDRPSTRRPENPPTGSSSRSVPPRPATRRPPRSSSSGPSSQRPSTRQAPAPSRGSASARPAPRERSRTPPANGGARRPPPRRPPSSGTS